MPAQRLVLAVEGVEPLDLEHHRRVPRFRGRAEIGADHRLVLLHLGRRALGDLAAEIERDDLVGNRHHQVHVMLDEQHRDLALVADAPDQRAELADLAVVEPAGRLVEQQQLRPTGKRARQFDPLAGAERQPGRPAGGHVVQFEQADQRPGGLAQRRFLRGAPRAGATCR